MSHNAIQVIEGLDELSRLVILDLGNNAIAQIQNVAHLTVLEDLWLNNNRIETLEGTGLERLTCLTTLYLEHNPQLGEYKAAAVRMVPSLKQLDADWIK